MWLITSFYSVLCPHTHYPTFPSPKWFQEKYIFSLKSFLWIYFVIFHVFASALMQEETISKICTDIRYTKCTLLTFFCWNSLVPIFDNFRQLNSTINFTTDKRFTYSPPYKKREYIIVTAKGTLLLPTKSRIQQQTTKSKKLSLLANKLNRTRIKEPQKCWNAF